MPPARCFEIFDLAHQPTPGKTLIVGSKVYKTREDRRARYPDVVGVDMLSGEGVDLVMNLEEPLPEAFGPFAHIDCLSVLEHSRRPWLMAENLQRLLLPGGSLRVTSPFVWRIHGYPSDYFRFTLAGIASLFPRIKWEWLGFAHLELSGQRTIPQTIVDGLIYFARTETYGFGRLA